MSDKIKIQNDVHLSATILKVIYKNDKGDGVLTEDIVALIKEKHEVEAAEVERVTYLLFHKYGILIQHESKRVPESGDGVMVLIRYSITLLNSRILTERQGQPRV